MARMPRIREKGGYWFSEAGGKARRYGRVSETSYAEAMSRMWEALAKDHAVIDEPMIDSQISGFQAQTQNDEPDSPHVDGGYRGVSSNAERGLSTATIGMEGEGMRLDALATAYTAWLGRNRSDRTLDERQRHIARFQRQCGNIEAMWLDAHHLEAFIEALRADGYAPDYIRKHMVSVKAMVSRGIKQRLLPRGFDPFATVDAVIVAPKVLLESDLPSRDEIQMLFAHARGVMLDVLRLYHATGCRTGELIEARCGDYQPQAGTLILAKHKRSRTMREPKPRVITLNDEAKAIVVRLIEDCDRDDFIIRNRKGNEYSRFEIARRFGTIRKNAKVRPNITIYSFRHLWISEMLMAGVDTMLVARMAGTSVKMLETVYGHFTHRALADAQAILDAKRKG